MGSKTDYVKQYKSSKIKWNKELKALRNENKMLYSIVKKSGLRRDINKINNFRAKSSKKTNVSSSDDLDSDSSLASDRI